MFIYKRMHYRFKMIMIFTLLFLSNSVIATQVTSDALSTAMAHLKKNLPSLGITEQDLTNAIVKDLYTSKKSGITHVYLRQTHLGLEIFNAQIAVNIGKDGTVLNTHNNFVKALSKVTSVTPKITAIDSVGYAAQNLNLTISEPLSFIGAVTGNDLLLTKGGISEDNIPVKLMYEPYGESVRLVWKSVLRLKDGQNWLDIRIDANSGEKLGSANWIADAGQYDVIEIPRVSPEDGVPLNGLNTVFAPANPVASPFGWHDTNGAAGREFNTTKGNNVFAQEDADNNNTGGFRPTGTVMGSDLDFSFVWNAALGPTAGTNQEAAIVNLFYWNNIIHDVLYQYGFDEASGNFQFNNYGNGGSGNDQVNADAQDGSGTNNANFGTPPDGSAPRMQMYRWTQTTPERDSDLENGIIAHEYGHGVSNRLTGGPANTSCLGNTEQMGEGWSDFFAYWLTTKAGDTGTTATGVGPYVLGQPNNTGTGIRPTQYSTNMAVNPTTYDDIKTLAVPHGIGYAWASMLWEMQWALIDQYGFDADFYNGIGGNNLAMQLVLDGMTLQPCNPGFVDGRDAILLADQNNNAGANQCLIWDAFAKRGLGFSAIQGSSNNRSDGTEAFDLPTICQENLKVEKSANTAVVKSGAKLEYTLTVTNDTAGPLTGVVVVDTIPADTSYVTGSATCPVTDTMGTLEFTIGSMASGAVNICKFKVAVSAMPSEVVFDDNMESGGSNWAVSHGAGSIDWALSTTNPHSGSSDWFAEDTSSITDQYLSFASPISIIGTTMKLTFWHHYNTETSWDGGVVEVSTDTGASWSDLGAQMAENGYNVTLNSSTNPLAGRSAFSGNSGGYIKTTVDLSGFAGDDILIRFRLGSDSSVGSVGWDVDDVSLGYFSTISNIACVTANEGNDSCSSEVVTPVEGFKASTFPFPIKLPSGAVMILQM